MRTPWIAAATLALAAHAAQAQSPVVAALKPLTLQQLEGAGFVRVRITVAGPNDALAGNPMGGLLGMLGGMLGGAAGGLQDMMWPIMIGVAAPGPDIYYTKLEPQSVAGEAFFLVYQPEGKPISMDAMNASKPPIPKAMTAQTAVGASLISVRQIVKIRDAKPFSLASELKESAVRVKEIEKFAAEQQKKDGGLASPIAPKS